MDAAQLHEGRTPGVGNKIATELASASQDKPHGKSYTVTVLGLLHPHVFNSSSELLMFQVND